MKTVFKTIAINIMVLSAMFGFMSYSLPLFYSLKHGLGPFLKHEFVNRKDILPNYNGISWARQYFIEQDKLSSTYFDYIGWRRNPFKGEIINIDADGIRKTVNKTTHGRKVFFFGGSTMWGFGVNDENTIPSLFSDIQNVTATNYGQSGWTTHQSLNMLQKLYIQGARPDIVVFYSGVNEVNAKCRTENSFFSSSREARFRHYLITDNVFSYQYLLEPVMRTIRNPVNYITKILINRQHRDAVYNCDSDHTKADLIAKSLYFDWLSAKQLVETYGGIFYAVLQPVAYIGNPKLDHLPDVTKDREWRLQFHIIYPLIYEIMNGNNFSFLDFTSIFDRDEYIYIDECHVTPNGNRLIAQHLASVLAPVVQADD